MSPHEYLEKKAREASRDGQYTKPVDQQPMEIQAAFYSLLKIAALQQDKATQAAELATAGEQLRRMREALERISSACHAIANVVSIDECNKDWLRSMWGVVQDDEIGPALAITSTAAEQTARENAAKSALLDWWLANPRITLCLEDSDFPRWEAYEEYGSINDRQWKRIEKGATPLECLLAARAAKEAGDATK